MKIYCTEEIKRAASCVDLMRGVLKGNERKPGFFDCPWRAGSDSGALHAEREVWYDHVAKEGGDAIELIIKAKNMTFLEANEFLGDHYGLAVKKTAKPAGGRIVAEYIYVDSDGIPLHKKIRYEPKSFSQEHFTPDGWRPGLGGVETVLYNLPRVLEAIRLGKAVFIVEGEKDADNLAGLGFCATTQTNGAGKWEARYTQTLKGCKAACIIADKDEVGRKAAQDLAAELSGAVPAVKVIEAPTGKDASDWIEAGATAADVAELARKAKSWRPGRTKELAKQCNQTPFANYRWESRQTETGAVKRVKVPKLIGEMKEDLMNRFLGFPRRVADSLFDHDQDTGEIRVFTDASTFYAWVQLKSRQPVSWAAMDGAVSREEFFQSLKIEAEKYEMITPVPTFPHRKEVYHTFKHLPAPSPDRRHLEEFLRFFNPATEEDAAMLKVLFASPLYYKEKVDRPLWVIDSDTAQGSGKTKAAEAVARLYGADEGDAGEPFWVDVRSITSEQSADRVWRRLLSASGRRKRVVLIDNVTNFLAAPSLATLITQGSISGLAPYGRGEETRPNDLTYIITSNSARFDRDLASRALFIKVNKKEIPDPYWASKMFGYIKKYRMNILSEIIAILSEPTAGELVFTRYRQWELDVMAPIIGDDKLREKIMDANRQLQLDSDYDSENAEEFRKFVIMKLRERYGASYDEGRAVFFPNMVLKGFYLEALPDEREVKKNIIPQILKNWVKAGLIPELNVSVSRFKNIRGMGWNLDLNHGNLQSADVFATQNWNL